MIYFERFFRVISGRTNVQVAEYPNEYQAMTWKQERERIEGPHGPIYYIKPGKRLRFGRKK